jgi:hypothetical protein
VGAEAPQRVLVGAQLTEVEAVGVDVVDVAELAAAHDQLGERAHPGVVLEQVADHQQRPALGGVERTLGVGDRLRERLLDEAVLAGLAARAPRGRRGSAPGVASRTPSRVGSPSTSSSESVKRVWRNVDSRRARTSGLASAAPAEPGAGDRVDVAGEVGAPVAEADDGE